MLTYKYFNWISDINLQHFQQFTVNLSGKSLGIPLLELQLECRVWRSFWPWRSSWRKTWSSYSPHTPSKTQCFHHWTLTSRKPGISSFHLNKSIKTAAVSQCWETWSTTDKSSHWDLWSTYISMIIVSRVIVTTGTSLRNKACIKKGSNVTNA